MIIGISGKKQVGKDTTFKIIQALEYYRKNFGDENLEKEAILIDSLIGGRSSEAVTDSRWEKKEMARALKEISARLIGCSPEDFEEEKFKSSKCSIGDGITNRELLQKIGTDISRNIDPDIWIKILKREYDPSQNWIITDIRFPNEARFIRDYKGILIRVLRNTPYSDSHLSESAMNEWTDFDYILDNNGTILDLIKKIQNIYGELSSL